MRSEVCCLDLFYLFCHQKNRADIEPNLCFHSGVIAYNSWTIRSCCSLHTWAPPIQAFASEGKPRSWALKLSPDDTHTISKRLPVEWDWIPIPGGELVPKHLLVEAKICQTWSSSQGGEGPGGDPAASCSLKQGELGEKNKTQNKPDALFTWKCSNKVIWYKLDTAVFYICIYKTWESICSLGRR